MASIGAAAVTSTAGLTFSQAGVGGAAATSTPGLGMLGLLVIAGAGLVDSKYIMPAIAGRPGQQRPPNLLDIPTMTSAPGSPLIFAMGRRVRFPVHVMFQSDKVREIGAGGKVKASGSIKKVQSDVGVLLNIRKSQKLTQLIGNGKLLVFATRNLVAVQSATMVASNVAGKLRITAGSVEDPDFADTFKVADRVTLAGWVTGVGPNINVGYWKVDTVVAHAGTTPGYVELAIYGGQTLVGLAATAGTEATPARITRVDDAIVEHSYNVLATVDDGNGNLVGLDLQPATTGIHPDAIFSTGDHVKLSGWTPSGVNGMELTVSRVSSTDISLRMITPGVFLPAGTYAAGTSTNAGTIELWAPQTFTPGIFVADPALSFHDGDLTQGEDGIIAQTEASGTIPGFRGLCYQTLDGFDLSLFGNIVPTMEALLEVEAIHWHDALRIICERSGIDPAAVDTSGVSTRIFEGYYIRGTTPGVQALQPLLVAGQIATQEREGVLCFFDLESADVVQIENGAQFSDLGTAVGGSAPNTSDKILQGQADEADLPTSVGVKFQDIDNLYADGYERFGLRSPTAPDHENAQDIDLSQLVLTRKQAANLAATAMRRTWVNANTVEMSLPAAYLEVLENDVLTVTDDDGNVVTCRVIRVEVGTNFIVNVVAVREHLDLAVHGSPIQGTSSTTPPVIVNAPVLRVQFHDMAPVLTEHMDVPGVYAAACAEPGGHWAGAALYKSRDGGTNWDHVADFSTETCLGVTTTSLAGTATIAEVLGTPGVFWDRVSTVDVKASALGLNGLSSFPESSVALGANWCRIGDEILGFSTVTVQPNGDYRLSNLLRGLRGTSLSCGRDKAAGQNFALLMGFMDSALFVPVDGTALPASLQFKVVPTGLTLADVDAIPVNVQARNARPFPVRKVVKSIGATPFDAQFAFDHWSRSPALPVGAQSPFPLDESYEGYTLRIYDPSGGVVKRTKTKRTQTNGSPTLRDRWLDYPASEQLADGYTPSAGTQFWIELVQLGDYGEGQAWLQQI